MTGPVFFDVVIPTSGRSSLGALLDALTAPGMVGGRIVVVDDRSDPVVALTGVREPKGFAPSSPVFTPPTPVLAPPT
nr:hypothetical protein [Actinomycetota bacterium]